MTQQSADNCPFPQVIELSSVDSTNNYALSLLRPPQLTERQPDVSHGWAVFAHEQYAGKGQRGKVWHSQKGENVHLSVILNPQKLALQQQFLLIAVVALAVREVFERHAQSDILIKWPNDIYFKERKAGGILIENIISGHEWKWAVVGVGLNINQAAFPHNMANRPVSLKQITGKNFDCLALAHELRSAIVAGYESANFSAIMSAYNQFLFRKGLRTRFEKNGEPFEAVVKEVLPGGQILLQAESLLTFDFGEISWLL